MIDSGPLFYFINIYFSTPDRPLMEILSSIKSDVSDSSLPYSGSAPSNVLSPQLSEDFAPDSRPMPTLQQPGEANGYEYDHPVNRSESLGTNEDSSLPANTGALASGEFDSLSSDDHVPKFSSSVSALSPGTVESSIDGLNSSLQQSSELTDSDVLSPQSELPEVVLDDSEAKFTDTASGSFLQSGSPSTNTPVDSMTSAISPSVLSPQHASGLESSTSSHGMDNQNGKSPTKSRSKSPSEAATVSLHARDTPELSSPKLSSANLSRTGSGQNTPRAAQVRSTSKNSSSKHSPAAQNTPPLAAKASNKSPLDLPRAVQSKLEDLVQSPDMPLPSPLYSQEENKSLVQDKVAAVDDSEDDSSQLISIYDTATPDDSADTDIISKAVNLSGPDQISDSHINRRRERTNLSSAPRSIISKPGLDDNNLRMFFKKIIADDSSEILMSISWGVSNLPSSPSCEIEVGTIISDKGIYLLEVLDPENHKSRPLSWTSENFPLAKITCCYHVSLRKIGIGIFDQSLTVESFEKGLVKRFVFFPHTYEKLNMFVENLKAAFDAYNLPYSVASSEHGFVARKGKGGMVIQNPGSDDMVRLKNSLVWAKSRAQVGNFVAVNSKSNTNPLLVSFEAELKKTMKDASEKFEIVQYVIVGELSSDILPVSNGKIHVQSRALVVTNDTIYLCKEELDSWAYETTSIRSPPFPRCVVINAHPISRISSIKVCDKSHPIVSYTDPLYEFSISFEELDDIQLSPTLSSEWVLCVHDRQYLDQLLGCLTHLSNELQKEKLKHVSVKHTSSRLMTPVSPKPPLRSSQSEATPPSGPPKKGSVISNRGTSPYFISSRILYEFSILTNYQRLKFFKKHVAQAEFLKSDEIPLSVFLAHCSSLPSGSGYVEIEACVLVSNYALYLLSGVDNIQQWMEAGGVTSFQRRDLLDRKNSEVIRCFYRLWLNEIKQVDVGVFYDAVSITQTKEPDSSRFTVHTENPSATMSFLSAVSCVVDLHDTKEEKEMDNLLSDYDFVIDTVKTEKKKSNADKQHYVEFVYHSDEKMDKLKKAMGTISPAITRNIPRGSYCESLKILYQQVMLLVEELRIRDILTSRFYPHLVFLTNFGIYVCLNETSEKCSPSVMDTSKLTVKKWCHIDLIERLHITSPSTSQYSCYNVVIYLRALSRASLSSEDSNSLSLLVQNSELLRRFLYNFSLMYYEKCGKQISITRDFKFK